MTLIRENLQGIEPRNLTTWLRSNGWVRVDDTGGAVLYRKSASDPAEGDFEVAVPLHSRFRDYTRRISEVIATLAVSTARPEGWIAQEVRKRHRRYHPAFGP